MNWNRVRRIGIGVVGALVCGWGIGGAMPPETASGHDPDGEVRPTRDPFVGRTNPRGRGTVRSLPTGIADFHLRGYIQNEQGEALALLEIEGAGLYLVRAGETIGLRTGQQAVQVTVSRIAEMAVQVRIGDDGPVLEVR